MARSSAVVLDGERSPSAGRRGASVSGADGRDLTELSPPVAVADSGWAARGACTRLEPDKFFVQGADQRKVKVMCAGCPVRNECLADALDNRIEFGVWGGMTERERRRLLRQHPGVEDWYSLLEQARLRAERPAV